MVAELRSFRTDFAWQRQYIRHMKAIIGQGLITEAPLALDMQRNTDLLILRFDDVTRLNVACRVRRHEEYWKREYSKEFTIRSERPTGAKTELAKVVDDEFGDYILYGFAHESEPRLFSWILGDLEVFRYWWWDFTNHYGKKPGTEWPNGDGTWFRAFRIDDLPKEFVVHRYDYNEAQAATARRGTS
jgi:hypothetical protein